MQCIEGIKIRIKVKENREDKNIFRKNSKDEFIVSGRLCPEFSEECQFLLFTMVDQSGKILRWEFIRKSILLIYNTRKIFFSILNELFDFNQLKISL